ncbi:hypothetical protein ACKKBG_A17530 [Auxenochlorella protothecoides x Auxenochlorella symbiontica]
MDASGMLPNIYCNHVPLEQLRRHPRFNSLPPPEDLVLGDSAEYRLVRQDHETWDKLHAGMLTTGVLASGLGFYESESVKRLRLPPSRASRDRLAAAMERLRQKPYLPPDHGASDAAMLNSAVVQRWQSRCREPDDDVNQVIGRSQVTAGTARNTARRLASLGLKGVGCAYGKVQEASTLVELLSCFPNCTVQEAGLHMANPAHNGAAALPPMGASPDGLLFRPVPDASERPESLTLSGEEVEQDGSPESSSGVWEVVEIKNVCPFGQSGSGLFTLKDMDPVWEVRAEWVPQLQFHMLCSGLSSALLVSRSATRGLRVFRMPADEAYAGLMKHYIARLWAAVRAGRRSLPANPWVREAKYQDLLRRTLMLARSARVVAEHPGAQPLRGCTHLTRWFLDDGREGAAPS